MGWRGWCGLAEFFKDKWYFAHIDIAQSAIKIIANRCTHYLQECHAVLQFGGLAAQRCCSVERASRQRAFAPLQLHAQPHWRHDKAHEFAGFVAVGRIDALHIEAAEQHGDGDFDF